MTKQPGRKKPKREIVDPLSRSRAGDNALDLQLLAEVLDENRLDLNADGWFALPWRDGWNAVGLATRLSNFGPVYDEVQQFLQDVRQRRDASPETYWRCGEIMHELNYSQYEANYRYAALRCLQLLTSNSHGGGEVYNVILRRAFDRHTSNNAALPIDISAAVLDLRCHDAIGVYPTLQNDDADRYRQAFVIAWKRGLFHAAYAIKNISPQDTICIEEP